MLARFQRQFVLITMVLVGLVSLAAFVTFGIMTVHSEYSNIDDALDKALTREIGRLDLPQIGRGGSAGEDGNAGGVMAYSMLVAWDGTVYSDVDDVPLDGDVVKAAAKAALSTSNRSGWLDDYGLFYEYKDDLFGYRIAFADKVDFDKSIWHTVVLLSTLWAILMVIMLIVTFFLSRYVTKPVKQAWEDQQRFIADASHELKTPLTVILADAAILEDNPDKTVAEQREWVEGIHSEADHMRHLTEAMLTLAQADAGVDLTPMMSRFNLSDLAEQTVLQFDAVAFERGILLEDDIEEGIEINGAQDRIENLLKTLLENACKYGADEPVKVELCARKGQAQLKVRNGGQRIPAEDLPHVFDRFYRSDKSRTRQGESASFGLGLSIAKSTAEMHHGSISVDSGDEGTVFTVCIPLAK